jgi:hypothetical protein
MDFGRWVRPGPLGGAAESAESCKARGFLPTRQQHEGPPWVPCCVRMQRRRRGAWRMPCLSWRTTRRTIASVTKSSARYRRHGRWRSGLLRILCARDRVMSRGVLPAVRMGTIPTDFNGNQGTTRRTSGTPPLRHARNFGNLTGLVGPRQLERGFVGLFDGLALLGCLGGSLAMLVGFAALDPPFYRAQRWLIRRSRWAPASRCSDGRGPRSGRWQQRGVRRCRCSNVDSRRAAGPQGLSEGALRSARPGITGLGARGRIFGHTAPGCA